MADFQPQADNKTVQVTNISPSANEKTVSDFFSFCGKISKLYLNKQNNSAVIQFESESAAKTALLLTNALIVDRPITVVSFTQPTTSSSQPASEVPSSDHPEQHLGQQVDPDHITQRDFGNVSDEERSKTSVIASLLAAGYVLGTDVLDQAKDYDEKHNLSLQAKVAVEQIKVKAHELDQQLKISETAASIKNATMEKAKQINENFQITEKANAAATTVKVGASAVVAKMEENAIVSSGIDFIKSTANKVETTVSSVFTDYKDQTSRAIEDKQRERGKFPPAIESDPNANVHNVDSTPALAPQQTPLPQETTPVHPQEQ